MLSDSGWAAPAVPGAAAEALPEPAPGVVTVAARPGALARAATEQQPADTDVRLRTTADRTAFEQLCAGAVDLVESLGRISLAQWRTCQEQGLGVVELVVAQEPTVLAVGRGSGREAACAPAALVDDLQGPPTTAGSWADLGLDDVALEAAGPGAGSVALRLGWLLGSPAERTAAASLRPRGDERRAAETLVTERRLEAERRQRAAGSTPGPAAREAVDAAWERWALARDARDRAVAAHRAAWQAALAQRTRADRLVVLPWRDYLAQRERVAAIDVRDQTGTGCVAPQERTLAEGRYPLAAPVRLTLTTRAWARPEVAALLAWLLPRAPALARERGLTPAPRAAATSQAAWLRGRSAPDLLTPSTTDPSGPVELSPAPAPGLEPLPPPAP
ncbi:hypothetical protein [Nocardioides nanhaiensis]|uniref:Uncharacterized protein n=1 Tax=Nocardioides nanhaiensis TaxID=1476871 RepID=A0ABP8W7G9_9ACTN